MCKETGANHKVAPVSFFYLHLSLKQKFPHCHPQNDFLILGCHAVIFELGKTVLPQTLAGLAGLTGKTAAGQLPGLAIFLNPIAKLPLSAGLHKIYGHFPKSCLYP